ncbi:unnamed protein product [Rhodiola kirilowii]
MHFYLTQLELARYLTEEAPSVFDEEYDPQVVMAFNTWKDGDCMCRNYVLNSLNDTCTMCIVSKARLRSGGNLWIGNTTKDAGSKKYILGRFLEFQMVDSKTVSSQVQEL